MLAFYSTIDLQPILDATYNAGRFWKGSVRDVVSMDIDPQHKPMIVGDNRKMNGVPSAKFGMVVYDPPHAGHIAPSCGWPKKRDSPCAI